MDQTFLLLALFYESDQGLKLFGEGEVFLAFAMCASVFTL